MNEHQPVEPAPRSLEPRVRGIAMIVGLLVGMALLVGTIILLDADDETVGQDQVSADQPTDEDRPDTSTDTTIATSPESEWGAAVEFRPSVLGPSGTNLAEVGGIEPGLYLWSDFEGWHLWSVGSAGGATTGSVVVDGEFGAAEAETGPATVDTTVQSRIEFQLGGEAVSGIRFNPGFFSNQIEIRVDGEPLPALFLGREATKATLPVVVGKNQPIRTLED